MISHSRPDPNHRPIVKRLREKLTAHIIKINKRKDQGILQNNGPFWAWMFGFHMSEQHCHHKLSLIQRLLPDQNPSDTEQKTVEPLWTSSDDISTPNAQRATLYRRLYTAMSDNEHYSITHGIRSGQTATVLAECMRIVKEADDNAYEPPLDSEQNAAQYKNFAAEINETDPVYHTFHNAYLAAFFKHWQCAPIVTTVGVALSIMWILCCFYPNVLLWSAQTHILFAIQSTIHCVKRSAQLLACASGIFAIWGILGYFEPSKPKNVDPPTPQPMQVNTWANNPIARIFSGMRCLFKTMYDYGRANPISMAVFGFAYWIPATMILGHDYYGWQFSGLSAQFYTHIILPLSHGLLSAQAAPWVTALCVGFLCGQLWVIAHDLITRRAQSFTAQSIHHAIITILDSLLIFGVLYFLALFMAGFPFLSHGCGSWYFLNFMTLSIKPALLLYDIISDPKRSIIGSTVHAVIGVPYWIITGKRWYASTPMPKHQKLLSTWLQRLQRAGHDLWHLLKVGLYEISVGFFLRDFLFAIAHVYYLAIVKGVAMTLSLCRCHEASKTFLTSAHSLNTDMAILTDALDAWIRLGLQRFEFRDLLLIVALVALAPPMMTWLYGGAALVNTTYPWFYPYIGWFGHGTMGTACAWSLAWLALITIMALSLERLTFACLPNHIDHATTQKHLKTCTLLLICITCMMPGILVLCHLQANVLLGISGATLLLPMMTYVLLSYLYPDQTQHTKEIQQTNETLKIFRTSHSEVMAYFYEHLGYYPVLDQRSGQQNHSKTKPMMLTKARFHKSLLDTYLAQTHQ